jgi:hypothetical protein
VRTLILLLVCAAFVAGGVLDARAAGRDRRHVVRTAVMGFAVGVVVCWVLVYVVGIFDNWTFSLRNLWR